MGNKLKLNIVDSKIWEKRLFISKKHAKKPLPSKIDKMIEKKSLRRSRNLWSLKVRIFLRKTPIKLVDLRHIIDQKRLPLDKKVL